MIDESERLWKTVIPGLMLWNHKGAKIKYPWHVVHESSRMPVHPIGFKLKTDAIEFAQKIAGFTDWAADRDTIEKQLTVKQQLWDAAKESIAQASR